MTSPKFHVAIQVPNIGRVPLAVPRTSSQIDDLRTRYEVIEMRPATTLPPKNSAWSDAILALVRLRQSAMGKGDAELGYRAEKAIEQLYGVQRFIEEDSSSEPDPFPESDTSTRHTLIGLGRGR